MAPHQRPLCRKPASSGLRVLLSYWLNCHFVFKVRMSLKGLLRFPLVYVVQYLVGLLLMFVLVEKLAVPKLLAPLLVIVVTVPLTFVLSRALLRPGVRGGDGA